MLPEHRQSEYHYPVPIFDLKKNDVDAFLDELLGFQSNFEDCFHRSESRGHFYRYMVGQFSELERKSIEPIALNVKDGKVRAMQRFISDAEWDNAKIASQYRSLVNEDLGSPNGAIIFDETGFVKKGNDSIGVARQYCSTIGKVENCQIGVFASYVSPQGYALLDKRLYIPEQWFSEEFSDKREKCQLPDDISFKTKPELAADMLNEFAKEQSVSFKYVLADSVYSSSPHFVEAVERLVDVTYFLSVSSDTLCWLKSPVTIEKTYKYRGETRSKRILAADEKSPISVSELAQNIHNYFWYRRTVSEGTKGPITYEFTKRRVVLSNGGLPQKTVWLIIKRTLGESPEYSFYISNAPASTRLKTFVWLSGLRWAIEQCFEETKTELGMDQYEVRKFMGWHHHIMVCILAHFFLWHLKIRLGKKSAVHYFVSASCAI